MSDATNASHDVNIKDLQVLLSIASSGSFRSAATQLFTTQPAVTRSVARLELGLGVTLFNRGPRGAIITAEGMAVLERAKQVLGLISEMRADAASPDTHLVRFGAAATAAGSYLAPFLAEWIPSHPSVRLRMLEDGGARLRRRLENNECDIAIVASPIPAIFDAAPITRVGMRAYFPDGHPLDTGDEMVSLAELAAYPLLINDVPFLSATLLTEGFDRAGIHPHVIYQSSIGRTLAVLAQAGLGVAVFGDSVDLRGTRLLSRGFALDDGTQLGFDLHVAWRREGTPQWIRDFGRDLSAFARSRQLPPRD